MKNLEKRIADLEAELAEMKDRIKQFENVMTSAFQLISKGERPIKGRTNEK